MDTSVYKIKDVAGLALQLGSDAPTEQSLNERLYTMRCSPRLRLLYTTSGGAPTGVMLWSDIGGTGLHTEYHQLVFPFEAEEFESVISTIEKQVDRLGGGISKPVDPARTLVVGRNSLIEMIHKGCLLHQEKDYVESFRGFCPVVHEEHLYTSPDQLRSALEVTPQYVWAVKPVLLSVDLNLNGARRQVEWWIKHTLHPGGGNVGVITELLAELELFQSRINGLSLISYQRIDAAVVLDQEPTLAQLKMKQRRLKEEMTKLEEEITFYHEDV